MSCATQYENHSIRKSGFTVPLIKKNVGEQQALMSNASRVQLFLQVIMEPSLCYMALPKLKGSVYTDFCIVIIADLFCSSSSMFCQCCATTVYGTVYGYQGCATTVYGTVYGYTVRYGNKAYSRIYTVLDRIYGKIRYSVRYGPNFESLSQKIKIAAAAFKSSLMLGGAAAALPQGLEFALHLFCWALSCCCRG